MSDVVAIIPARGGSKGIHKKNLINFCGKPLVAWSILHAIKANSVDSVWVTSDDDEILEVARSLGAEVIERPHYLSGDTASSESAWLHALDTIEERGIVVDTILGLQATSPIREVSDLNKVLQIFSQGNYDSMLSVAEVEDFFTWRMSSEETLSPVNYDFSDRPRRQTIGKRYLETGSLYVFRPQALRSVGNRLSGRIGPFLMERYKMFQIDSLEDIKLCSKIMVGFGLDQL